MFTNSEKIFLSQNYRISAIEDSFVVLYDVFLDKMKYDSEKTDLLILKDEESKKFSVFLTENTKSKASINIFPENADTLKGWKKTLINEKNLLSVFDTLYGYGLNVKKLIPDFKITTEIIMNERAIFHIDTTSEESAVLQCKVVSIDAEIMFQEVIQFKEHCQFDFSGVTGQNEPCKPGMYTAIFQVTFQDGRTIQKSICFPWKI